MNEKLVGTFDKVLDQLVDGATYTKLPPQGPLDIAVLSEAELKAKTLNENGESITIDSNYDPKIYKNIRIDIEDNKLPHSVKIPTDDELDNINIFGIDGSNQKIEKNSFYLIIARAAIVNFRYTKGTDKPYFYTKLKDISAVTWVDKNIFKEDVVAFTNNNLKNKTKDEAVDIFNFVKNENEKPFLVGYDSNKTDKSPSSHALGWAVKFQQALELACFEEVKTDTSTKTVCIKDGPLFSTSSSKQDTLDGLNPIFSWTKQTLVCVSKRINDSKLLIEAFGLYPELIETYFPNKNLRRETIQALGTDSLLIQRILPPGYRTPLIAAVPMNRFSVYKANEELMPLCCYYMRRKKPHTIIRLEIPIFMWNRDPAQVEEAIKVVAWQHELGVNAPLVQLAADELCQLAHEKNLLEMQTEAALSKKNLELIEVY